MDRRNFLHRSAALLATSATASVVRSSPASEQPSHRKVRVGLVGTSHSHAAGKLGAILSLPNEFELVGVVEPDAGRQQALHAQPKYRNMRWMAEKELLATPGLNAVVVETAVGDQLAAAQRCVDAGMHVHLEKPGGESHVEFVRLFEAAAKLQRHIQMGYMLRHNPAFEFCFRAVREGWLGRVFEVTGAMSKSIDDASRRELVPYTGGAMFELGCHVIDAIVTVLGPPQKIRPFGRRTRPQRDSLLDNQLAVFEYANAIGTIRSSVVEPGGQERRHFVVSGENGTIEIRPLEPPQVQVALERAAGGFKTGVQQVLLRVAPGRYNDQLSEFAAIVRGEHQPHWSAEHDLHVHRTVLEASGLPVIS